MKQRMVLMLLVAVGLVVAVAPAIARAQSAPVYVTFQKHVVDPSALTFEGTTGGAVPGVLTSFASGPVWTSGSVIHFTSFDWVVSAGDESFTARTSGIFNTKTGAVIMNGKVVSGFLEGARVHEEGQLVDAATFSFEGVIQIMPATR